MTVFGDVNVSVYGNSDVLKFTFTFKCVLLENQKCNYFNHLLYIAALYLLFIPVRNFLNKAIGIINFAKHFQNFIDDTMI